MIVSPGSQHARNRGVPGEMSNDLVAEQAERAELGAESPRICCVQLLVDGHEHAKIARRVGVDRQELDRLDRAGELAGDDHRAAFAQPVRVRRGRRSSSYRLVNRFAASPSL